MNGEQRKVAVMLIRFPDGKKGPVITLRAAVGRLFVSKYMYWASLLIFLRELNFIKEVNSRTNLGLDIEDTYIYELAQQTTNRQVVRGDY